MSEHDPAFHDPPSVTPAFGLGADATLRKDVAVFPDGASHDVALKVIPAGTPATDIPESELAQLAAEHFNTGGE